MTNLFKIREELQKKAEVLKAQYPQYKNHWDGWGLAETLKPIRLKSGDIPEGTFCLLAPGTDRPEYGPKAHVDFVTIHSPISGMDTSVELRCVKVHIEAK